LDGTLQSLNSVAKCHADLIFNLMESIHRRRSSRALPCPRQGSGEEDVCLPRNSHSLFCNLVSGPSRARA
jgi:hypothetical protein